MAVNEPTSTGDGSVPEPDDQKPGPTGTPTVFDKKSGFFGEPRARFWTVIAGIAALVGLPLSAAGVWLAVPSDEPESTKSPEPGISSPSPRAPLELVSLAVQKPEKVDADFSGGGATRPKGKIDAAVVDITVKNVGAVPIVILAADVTVWYAERMEGCPQSGGGVEVSAGYDIKLPEQPPDRPFTRTREMRFEVKSGDTERFALTIGPEKNEQYSSWIGWLYGFDLSLRYDESPEPLDLGKVALVAEPGKGEGNFKNSPPFDFECIERNAALVAELVKTPATRSEELDWLAEKYGELTKPDAAKAEKVCVTHQTDAAPLGLEQVCLRYTRRGLTGEFALTSTPLNEQSQVVLHIRPRGTEQRFKVVSTLSAASWKGSWIAPDEGEETSSGDCGFDSNKAVMTASRPLDFNHLELEITVELRDITVPDSPRVIDEIRDPIRVVRGNP